MAWFRLAGEGCFHAKVLAAKNDAYGAWCRAGQWSSEHLTEGRITRDVALAIAPVSVWNRLRDAKAGGEHGLVEEIDGGWQIHDYLDWNPTAEQALAKRAARAEAGRKGGEAKAARKQREGSPPGPSQANDLAIASTVAKQKPTPSPSPLPDQIPENLPVSVSQEPRAPVSQEPSQSTHTQSTESYEMPTLPDAEWLAVEFRRYPAIDRFAADANLVADLAGGLQAKSHTIERAREIVADFVTKTGIEARSMDRAEFQRRLGGFVTSARLHGVHVRPAEQNPTRSPPKLCAAFARGHEAHGAAGYPVPQDPRDETALEAVAKARCPTLTGAAAAEWIAQAVRRFLRAREQDTESQYWKGGTSVQGFVNWVGTETKADAERAEVMRLAAAAPRLTDEEALEMDRKQREERSRAKPEAVPDTPSVVRVLPVYENRAAVRRVRA